MQTQIFAHRGASADAPENTMPAFELAERQGADGIELDVHLTSDNRLAVIHDDTTDRTSGVPGAVHDTPFARLRALDVSMGRPGFSGARIPALEEVYGFAARTRLTLNVEIKEDRYDGGFVILKPLLELAARFGIENRIVYSSFNHYALRELKSLAPGAATAVLCEAALVDVWEYARRVPADGVHPWFPALRDPQLVPACRAAGLAVRPWTVDGAEDLAAVFRAGADAVITDLPERARSLRG